MLQIVLLSDETNALATVLPGLELLSHQIDVVPLSSSGALKRVRQPDVVVLDGTTNMVAARNTAQSLAARDTSVPVLLALTEGGMAAVAASWCVTDVVLHTAGPAEIEARLRLASVRGPDEAQDESVIRAGNVTIDDGSYTVKIGGAPLNLTYKEFELLKYLAQNVGRVFTRAQLLSQVWGYDYYGGTRTVDVHIRRLRAKLGADHEHLITTVRNVGYSFTAGRDSES
ncbi:response regulator transcription factor [Kocuria sp. cx-455]|uniref:response regulator transcription factor n=1 Tax=unclassified Candidatus Sulfotelmatobacter TaxID=2635724 RepID=UPI0016830AFB|nr:MULTISPECIES: response regulator transcription factor [unclassified Candidatus Sulfotelmatobacter]MBD2762314.1 response regulator transcription factor [Kocuria sp. cx-116]MBD2764282.1 response regulator transcription factor [Kocuria sp. cx-455]